MASLIDSNLSVTNAHFRAALTGISNKLVELRLSRKSDVDAAQCYLYSDTNLRPATTRTYRTHIRMLSSFLCLIGDYESLIILSKYRPEGSPSMLPRSIVLYIRYKRIYINNHILLDLDNATPVLDVFGNTITCLGGWKAPVNVFQFIATIMSVHVAMEQISAYRDKCDGCIAREL